MSLFDLKNIRVDPVSSLYKFHTSVDALRLDLVDPVISGNKWFKLKKYIEEAKQLQKSSIITFGGAFSNHILATAAAAKMYGLKSTGIIRGERPSEISLTLQQAQAYGMQLVFISREAYKNKQLPDIVFEEHDRERYYLVNEGG